VNGVIGNAKEFQKTRVYYVDGNADFAGSREERRNAFKMFAGLIAFLRRLAEQDRDIFVVDE
jgi:UDP-2,3-diacylglucosamine pyrophosphatase LpxH